MTPSDRFWRALLAVRATHLWGNFSWLSLGTLMQSANDTLARLDGGQIIDTRRMRWVAAQRARGIDPLDPVRLPDARRVLVLGDPGEMDGSQYVLVRDLAATNADVLVLMSDVVYPAGDINAWRDAVYLPYVGLPRTAWNTAVANAPGSVPLPPWQVFATPGNHDWYDGLTGFMFHACGAEPLPPVAYSGAGMGPVARVIRRAWQNPARPDRAMLDPLRAEMAKRWPAGEAPRRLPGPMPFQPGPYYAIDIGEVMPPGAKPHAALRIVTVDTGVDGSIDVEQARWVRAMLSAPGPKVLITGKPMLVDNKVGDIPVNRSPLLGGSDGIPASVRGLLMEDSARGVVAAVAGDIHNFQRMAVGGAIAPDDDSNPRSRSVRLVVKDAALEHTTELPPLHIVAGGGGAYLSATHTIKLDAESQLPLAGSNPATTFALPLEAHTRFPSRGESAHRFAGRVGPMAGIALGLLGLVLIAALSIAFAHGVDAADQQVVWGKGHLAMWTAVGGVFTVLLAVGLLGASTIAWNRRARAPAIVLMIGGVAAVAAAAVLLRDADQDAAKVFGVALAMAVALPVLPVALPVVRAFPALRRMVPIRVLVVSGLGAAVAGLATLTTDVSEHVTAVLIVAVPLVAALIVALMSAAAALVRARDRWASEGVNPFWCSVVSALSLWPVLLVVPPILLADAHRNTAKFQSLSYLIVLIEVSVVVCVLAALVAAQLRKAWCFRPKVLTVLAPAAAVCGGILGWFAADWVGLSGSAKQAAGAAIVGAGLPLIATGVLLLTSSAQVALGTIGEALLRRDGEGSETPRGRDVFRTMVVAGVPKISELAEATSADFHKSFLTIEPIDDGQRTTSIVFEAFGVDEERLPHVTGHPALSTPPVSGGPRSRGSYLVDRVTVEFE
jgi:hypothetical protein